MIRIDTVRVDKAESKEDLYLMSLRVSADNKGLKELSNALDNVIYTIEHSEALLSKPLGLIDVDEEKLMVFGLGKGKIVKDGEDITPRRDARICHNTDLSTTLEDRLGHPKEAKIGEILYGPIKLTGIDSTSGNFYYVDVMFNSDGADDE